MVLFVVIDYYSSAKNGIYTAVISSAIFGAISYYLLGELDYEVFLVVGAMLLMGYISLKKSDTTYFKLQPVVTAVCLIIFLSYFQLFDVPYMLKIAPSLEKFIPPENLALIQSETGKALLGRLSLYSIFWIGIHGLLVAYAATKLSNTKWLILRSLGGPIIAVGVMATEFTLKV
jgi:hypothetical protein